MKKIFVLLNLFFVSYCFAQNDTANIRLEKDLEKETDVSAKLKIIEKLAQNNYLYNSTKTQEYIDKGIFLAEQSRDRNLMIKARINFGAIYASAGLQQDVEKAKQLAEEALKISKTENVSYAQKVAANMFMARIERVRGKSTDGLIYNQEAIAIANESGNDSLKTMCQIGYGNTLLFLDEKLKAFKSYMAAEEIAEKSKQKNKEDLLYEVNGGIAKFYTSAENYDRAIDYQYKMLDYAKKTKEPVYQISLLGEIGANYVRAKKYDAAKGTYIEMGKVADSIKNEEYKTSSKMGLLNVIVNAKEGTKALEYLKTYPEIKTLYEKAGISYIYYKGLGDIFHQAKNNDSANYYYEKALPEYDKKTSLFQRIDLYQNYGYHLYTIGNYKKAISILQTAKLICDSVNNVSTTLNIVDYLDSCYQKVGDYKNAFYYSDLKNKIKEEIEEKSKAKEVLAVEIDSENKRKERLAKEEEEATIKRHNWQYMGIVMAIISLFTLLTAIGVFNVPLKWVRALGFISFIFLFEFIILLADTWIHHATHGEPWKVLGIKVILIALLLPFHHWLEHKAIHYITQRRNRKLGHEEVLSSVETKNIKLKKE